VPFSRFLRVRTCQRRCRRHKRSSPKHRQFNRIRPRSNLHSSSGRFSRCSRSYHNSSNNPCRSRPRRLRRRTRLPFLSGRLRAVLGLKPPSEILRRSILRRDTEWRLRAVHPRPQRGRARLGLDTFPRRRYAEERRLYLTTTAHRSRLLSPLPTLIVASRSVALARKLCSLCSKLRLRRLRSRP
jgi:hypothetical protein